MADKIDWPPPMTVLAFGVVVAVAGVALYFVVPAIGTAIGLGVAVSTTGLSTAGVVGAWVAPVASGGVALVGVTLAAAGIKKVSDSVQAKPYEWGLPLLAAFAGFMSTVAKDTGLFSNVSKWVFGGMTALLIVFAGACYKHSGVLWKSVAITLYLLPPAALLGWSTLSVRQSSGAFRAVNIWTWIGLASILVIGLLIGLLAHLERAKHRAAA